MIYLKTRIDTLDQRTIKRIARNTIEWCRRTLGENRRKKWKLKCYVRRAMAGDDTCGEYDCWDNEIYIYWNNCESVRELIATIVHEWTHQNQPIITKYYKYPGTYSRNPYERAARYAEMKWTPVIWRELKHKINNKA